MMKGEKCIVESCDRVASNSRGWCSTHYSRWQRYGDPRADQEVKTSPGTGLAWLMTHVESVAEECILWPWPKQRGYGQLRFQGRQSAPHRVMCFLAHGAPF